MRSIVRSASALAAAFITVAVLAAGCTSPKKPSKRDAERNAAPEQTPPTGAGFGSRYEIVDSPAPAAPDQPPALDGDSLRATVRYTGGCKTHAFALRAHTRRDTARLRLVHDAHGDDCSERLLDDVRVKVPAQALRASTVVLLNPQGGAPFILRWDAE